MTRELKSSSSRTSNEAAFLSGYCRRYIRVHYLVVALEANSAPQQLAEFGTLSGTPAGALFLIMYLVRSYISLINTDIASVFAPSDQATRNRHIGRHFPNKEMLFRTSLYIYYFLSIVLIITLDNRA